MDPVQDERIKRTRELLTRANGRINPDSKESLFHVLDTAVFAAEPNLSAEQRDQRAATALLAMGDAQVRLAVSFPEMVASAVDNHTSLCPLRLRKPKAALKDWRLKDLLSFVWHNKLGHYALLVIVLAAANRISAPTLPTQQSVVERQEIIAAVNSNKSERMASENRIIAAVKTALLAELKGQSP